MSEKWYYVQNGERQGPVEFDEVLSLYQGSTIGSEDYVWTKGFEDWKKIKDVPKFSTDSSSGDAIPPVENSTEVDLQALDPDHRCLFIKTGKDRGGNEVEYGPFSINILKKLYSENRVNGKTFVFAKGMGQWMFLADMKGFESVFEELPPVIDESERRSSTRSPFIARMFIEKNQNVFEGICRDISVGGMQVLVDEFPANVGEKISINVHPENTDHHFVASGKIVRLLEGNQGFSFRFIDLKDDAINAINSYLDQQS